VAIFTTRINRALANNSRTIRQSARNGRIDKLSRCRHAAAAAGRYVG